MRRRRRAARIVSRRLTQFRRLLWRLHRDGRQGCRIGGASQGFSGNRSGLRSGRFRWCERQYQRPHDRQSTQTARHALIPPHRQQRPQRIRNDRQPARNWSLWITPGVLISNGNNSMMSTGIRHTLTRRNQIDRAGKQMRRSTITIDDDLVDEPGLAETPDQGS